MASQHASNDLADAVRHWVHFDNLAESLNKQINNVRSLRNQYETRVLEHMEAAGLKKANLKITGATLSCATRHKSTDLSWTFLEEQLHEYYKTHRPSAGRDETKEILAFLHRQRGGRTIEYLKKTSMTQSTSIPPTSQPVAGLLSHDPIRK
jgi:hypothetical protein